MKKNKRWVIVTGCSSGIGLCTAKLLINQGYDVIATVRSENHIELLHQYKIMNVVLMDLSDSASVDRASAEIVQLSEGEIYGLFNNAAYGQPGAVEDLSRELLQKQFETNLFGTHQLTTLLLPYMLKQPAARIIQNSSVLGFAAMPMRGAYNASKFALEGLSDTLRLELRKTNVKVSLIEPGPILSSFRKNALLAFKQVDYKSSRHQQYYDDTFARLNKEGPAMPFTLGPEAVAKKVLHALNSHRPKIRYYVTFPTYLFAYLRRVLPTALLDTIIVKVV